jgi:putative transposase
MADAARGFPALANGLQSFLASEAPRSLGADHVDTQSPGPRKKEREATPSYLIIDSQSVKCNAEGEARGFHGGKKVKGRSRQIAVDTEGLIWAVHVHAANGADSVEGCVLADLAVKNAPKVEAFCVDAGYRGSFELYVEERWQKPVHVSMRIADGFAVLPKRWIVERTFAWGNGSRRLSKDYEKSVASSEAMVQIAAAHRALKLLRF